MTEKKPPAPPPPVEQDCLVDANVMMHALRPAAATKAPREREASRFLIGKLSKVQVSAIVWMEVVRGIRDDEEAALKILRSRTNIHPVSPPVADLAAEILRRRDADPSVCPRCYNPRQSDPCGDCGVARSRISNMNDAITMATAIDRGLKVLYTYDGGFVDLARSAAMLDLDVRVEIKRPPSPLGPLFDPEANPQLSPGRGEEEDPPRPTPSQSEPRRP